MNYYKHYIGDFQRDTSHLSLTERGAYLALIHHYYATEMPLPNNLEALCRIAGAMTKPERDAVREVMRFFEAVDSGLMHSRIEAELDKHEDRADKNRAIALEREAKRREKRENEASTNRAQSVNESCTNDAPTRARPITSNQEPTPKVPKGTEDGFQNFWDAWPATDRKVAKKTCRDKWVKLGLNAVAEQILAHVEAQKETRKWQEGYEPAPLTYINQRRWEDGASQPKAPARSV